MSNQFWKSIKPVVGEKFPDGAEANVYGTVWCKTTLIRPALEEFIPDDLHYEWRVPVEVIPLDVAVDAVMGMVRFSDGYYACGAWEEELTAKTQSGIRELVKIKLRELANGERNA